MGIGLGIGLKFGGAVTIDQQAQDHFNRVVAIGGTIPAGLVGCDAWFKAVKGVYGVSDITSAISSGIHPHYLGYKAGAGSGATLGNAAQTCYNAIGATGDVVQTTAASQPLILPHTGTNYVWLPGVAGNYFSANSPLTNITGDIRITADVILSNVSSFQCLWGKNDSDPAFRNYWLLITNTGRLALNFRMGGVDYSNISTASITTATRFVRATRNASSGEILFYTSLDGINYSQLGSAVIGVSGIVNSGNNLVAIGQNGTNQASALFLGVINRIEVSNSISGPSTIIFNPANYNRATSQTSWTSSTGEVWTLNTPSTNNALKAAIVDTTYLMGNGTSIGMRAASLNMNQTGVASYTAIRKFVNTVGSQIITELGASISSAAGKYFGINFTASQEEFGVYANVGLNNSRYSSTSTALKLATQIIDINNANEASPYLINNSSQTFVAQDSVSNNTAAMNGTGYNLLARNNAASLWANVMFACDIVSKNADSTGTQTAMYSALKPFLVNCI